LTKTKFIALVKQNGGKKPKQGLRFCTVRCRDKEVVNQSTHENVSSSKNRRYSSWPTFYTQKYGFVIFTNIIVYEKLEPVGNYKHTWKLVQLLVHSFVWKILPCDNYF